MELPGDLLYTRDHAWARVEGNVAVIGVTDELLDMLESVDFVDLPAVGDELEMDVECASLHYSGGVYELPAPLTGRVLAVNRLLRNQAEELHFDPYGAGWVFKMEFDEPDEVEMLYTRDQYINELEIDNLEMEGP